MPGTEFTIQTSSEEGKGRSFTGVLLAFLAVEDMVIPVGASIRHNFRPIFAVVGSGETEIRPLVVNLKMGKVGEFNRNSPCNGNHLEFLKSTKPQIHYNRCRSGATATFVLGDVFDHNPGMVDPLEVKFIAMPAAKDVNILAWDQEQAYSVVERYVNNVECRDLTLNFKKFIPYAPWFATQLDSRTRCPLINEPAFYALILYLFLSEKLAGIPENNSYYNRSWGSTSLEVKTEGLESLGYVMPLIFKATHEQVEGVLKRAAAWYITNGGSKTTLLANKPV